MKVNLYSKPNCQACKATVRKFNELGVDYEPFDISTDPDAYARATSLGDGNFKEAPIIEVSDGRAWSGYRPDLIKTLVPAPEAPVEETDTV